jgi:hypothetical protein
MNRQTNKERLLTDVIGEESEAGFNEALLNETLRLARRRRVARRVRRICGSLAVVVAIASVVIGRTPRTPVSVPLPALNYQLTRSQPLPANSIVSTRPLAADQRVVSTAVAGVIETTVTNGAYHEVGDDELLALAPQPAALVRRGPGEAELVFVTPPDAEDSHQN